MKVRSFHLALIVAVAGAGADDAAARDILRCVDGRGGVTYQEVACPNQTTTERSGIPTEFPEPNLLERDRLFAREAALDRRLERRRDREVQEAQMREARAERNAERDRLAALIAAQQSQPQYVIVFPMVGSRHWAPGHRRIAAPGTTRNQSSFR